jgi:hypothetical protein
MDSEEERWPVYEAILGLQDSWNPDCRPEIGIADDRHLLQHMTRETLSQGMELAKIIAVAGHKQVLEDGPDVDDPEGQKRNTATSFLGRTPRTCSTRRRTQSWGVPQCQTSKRRRYAGKEWQEAEL